MSEKPTTATNTAKSKSQAKQEAYEQLVSTLDLGYIHLRGVKLRIDCDLHSVKVLEERIGYMNTWDDKLKNPASQLDTVTEMITEFANCALRHAGEEPFLTADWVRERMLPGQIQVYKMSASYAVARGNETETAVGGHRDKILERIKKAGVTKD